MVSIGAVISTASDVVGAGTSAATVVGATASDDCVMRGAEGVDSVSELDSVPPPHAVITRLNAAMAAIELRLSTQRNLIPRAAPAIDAPPPTNRPPWRRSCRLQRELP